MRQLVNTAPAVTMVANRAPLSISMTFELLGGQPLTLATDNTYNGGLWIPDRKAFPLTIHPIIEATSIDWEEGNPLIATSIANGDTSWVLVDRNDPNKTNYYKRVLNGLSNEITISWYVNTTDLDHPATASDTGYTLEDGKIINKNTANTNNYVLLDNGDLRVHKNVDINSPITIICRVKYVYSRSNELYTLEKTLTLSSENKPELFMFVDMLQPEPFKFKPLKWTDSTKVLTALIKHGSLEMKEEDNCYAVWYLNESPIPYPSQNPNDPNYTWNSITLDMAKLEEHSKITVKVCKDPNPTTYPSIKSIVDAIVAHESDSTKPIPELCACEDSRLIEYDWGEVLVIPYCTSGTGIKDTEASKTFAMNILVDGQDANRELIEKYMDFEWYLKKEGEAAEKIQDTCYSSLSYIDSMTCSIPINKFQLTAKQKADVYVNMYRLTPLEIITKASKKS